MARWLLKSEPAAFSWAQQVAAGTEPWTGVRNHQARNNLQAMRRGDQAFFYHSEGAPAIVGVAGVAREACPDPTGGQGPWRCVDVTALGALPQPVSLARTRTVPALAGLPLLRQPRLSVSPVPPDCWALLCAMGGWTA